jgi:hypothetical protein
MERRIGSTSRREALASRRAARESTNTNGNTGEPSRIISIHESNDDNNWRRSKRVPIQNNLLASLSRALTNIDAQNSHEQNSQPTNIHVMSSEEKRYRRITLNPPQHFGGYLNFTRFIIQLLSGFTICYLLLFVCCLPMLASNTISSGKSTMGDAELKRGESFTNIRGRDTLLKVKSEWGTMKQRAIEWERAAKESAMDKMEDVLESSTVGRKDGEDALKAGRLLEEAVEVFDKESGEEDVQMKKVHDHWEEALKSWEEQPVLNGVEQQPVVVKENDAETNEEIYRGLHGDQKPGFMVLGMHRSGTSMLSGLLVKGFGYETGGPLIGAAVSLKFCTQDMLIVVYMAMSIICSTGSNTHISTMLISLTTKKASMNASTLSCKTMNFSPLNKWDGASTYTTTIQRRHSNTNNKAPSHSTRAKRVYDFLTILTNKYRICKKIHECALHCPHG